MKSFKSDPFFGGKHLTSAEKMGLQAPIWGAHHFFFLFLTEASEGIAPGPPPKQRKAANSTKFTIQKSAENIGNRWENGVFFYYHLYICKWRF